MTSPAIPPNLAELQAKLRIFPDLFKLSEEADIYLTPINTGLKTDCANFFHKESFVTPSEMLLALLCRQNVDLSANIALIDVIDAVGSGRFINKEPEGLTKIVQSLRKKVSVNWPDISSEPITAILESVTPAYDGQALPINWVIQFSAQFSETSTSREMKAPLAFLSRYFNNQ